MISQNVINEVIDSQRRYFVSKRTDLVRESLPDVPIEKGKATVITGMRRCGKCTLLLQLQKQFPGENIVYLNFEDIRLAGFCPFDFNTLADAIFEREATTVFFDEIHIAEGWEEFVQRLLSGNITVYIADTLSSIRNLPFVTSLELFPFSYSEYITFSHQDPSIESFTRYMKIGGIPKIVRNEGTSIMNNILDDIVVRDIAVRKGIREVEALRQLAVYLLSNTGKEIAANQLIGMFGLRSCATIVDFMNYYQSSYLMDFIPKYSPSEKIRSRNPKRVYATDLGLINIGASLSSPSSKGHSAELQMKLENIVYSHLRRKSREIFYFSEKKVGSCHFITAVDGMPSNAVYVCHYLSEYDKFLLYQNLSKVLPFLSLSEATVVTMGQKETFPFKGITIHIVPAFEFCSK